MTPPLPETDGGWGTIVADPPWSFSDKGSRIAPEKSVNGYSTMTINDIAALRVRQVAAAESHLYLWTTDSHIREALFLVEWWGFEYKQILTWVKRGVTSKLQIGMGHWFRHATEHILFGVRGKLGARSHSIPNVFEYPRRGHSEKPPILHEWAEQMSPGPRLELFARSYRPAWQAWGNELPKETATNDESGTPRAPQGIREDNDRAKSGDPSCADRSR